ncbi:hypothetical protein B4O97_17895 [Marispirochaeta aestuarii]|uniref:Signal transduction histidine kinase internal region domain-containing protein n=1 Tax=Marispirochaeta aestuarii TaxID=1963862 RepID=A0A1Y1RTF2_9SPIO|nr:hypothetical protein [Marispirochaeta aestuarii]ORC30711.1 hypothetical protein B4O97_17895 [Marispirochaeta aestuarii]
MSHRIGNSLAGIRAYINLYFSDDMIDKSDGLEKVDDIIQTMTFLNYEFFKNFEQQVINMKSYLNFITIDLAEKYFVPRCNIQLRLFDKEQHIDKALPFGMLYTIMLTNIYMEIRERVEKPTIKITMVDKLNKTDVAISISKKNIFHSVVRERQIIETEIIEALLTQIEGTMIIDQTSVNSITFVL